MAEVPTRRASRSSRTSGAPRSAATRSAPRAEIDARRHRHLHAGGRRHRLPEPLHALRQGDGREDPDRALLLSQGPGARSTSCAPSASSTSPSRSRPARSTTRKSPTSSSRRTRCSIGLPARPLPRRLGRPVDPLSGRQGEAAAAAAALRLQLAARATPRRADQGAGGLEADRPLRPTTTPSATRTTRTRPRPSSGASSPSEEMLSTYAPLPLGRRDRRSTRVDYDEDCCRAT